jgi:hypothetical protein
LVALGVSLILPKWYSARAVLLPPTEDDIGSSMAQFMPRGLGGAFRLPGQTTLADVFVAELKSRTLADRIIQRFDLVKRYHVPDQDKAVLALEDHVVFKVGDEGTIAIVVEDRDPKTAAAMANAYVEELDHFNLETRTTSAKRTRAFIDERLTLAKHDLAAAEDRLRAYQQEHKLPAISPSDKSSSDMGANLMAQKSALECGWRCSGSPSPSRARRCAGCARSSPRSTARWAPAAVRAGGHPALARGEGAGAGVRAPDRAARGGADPRDAGHADRRGAGPCDAAAPQVASEALAGCGRRIPGRPRGERHRGSSSSGAPPFQSMGLLSGGGAASS